MLDGKLVQLTRGEALAHHLIAKALKGDNQAARIVTNVLRSAPDPTGATRTHEEWLDYLDSDEETRRPTSNAVTSARPDDREA